jgi:hypothetical protein
MMVVGFSEIDNAHLVENSSGKQVDQLEEHTLLQD